MNAQRAAIYARVSTVEQLDGTSLDTQVERCRRHAESQGWNVVGEWVDRGVSGAKASRPELDRLLAAVRGGDINLVVVAKLDRIGRSMRHLAALLGELDDRSVSLVSVGEAFDSATPSGRLQRNMLASFAEFERERIRERTTAGQEARARAGRWIGGPAPFGYRTERLADGVGLAVDAAEAATIRRAFDLLVTQRLSTGQAAARLNAAGMRPRRSPRWTGHNLRTQLLNATVISGSWQWRRGGRGHARPPVAVTAPAIISVEDHERLKARLTATTIRHRSHADRYLLSGRIFSPHGAAMYGFPTHAFFYRCAHTFATTRPPDTCKCTCRTVRVDTADAAVWDQVRSLLANPARLLAMSGLELARGNATSHANGEDLASIDRRINRLERAAGEQLSMLLANGVDARVAQHAAQALTDELMGARDHRQRLAAWQIANDERVERAQRLAELAGHAGEVLPDADMATKRHVLELLEVRVTVTGWERCETCAGTGWVGTRREKGQRRGTRETAQVCARCRKHRYIPHLVIEGAVPETDTLRAPAPDTADIRWPFRVVS